MKHSETYLDNYSYSLLYDLREDLINLIDRDQLKRVRSSKAIFSDIPLKYGASADLDVIRKYLNTEKYKIDVRGRGGRSPETSKVPYLLWESYLNNQWYSPQFNASIPIVLAEHCSVYVRKKDNYTLGNRSKDTTSVVQDKLAEAILSLTYKDLSQLLTVAHKLLTKNKFKDV